MMMTQSGLVRFLELRTSPHRAQELENKRARLGDRGERARCRNGVCLLNDVPAVLVRKIFEVFLRPSLCNGRVTDACRRCSKTPKPTVGPGHGFGRLPC